MGAVSLREDAEEKVAAGRRELAEERRGNPLLDALRVLPNGRPEYMPSRKSTDRLRDPWDIVRRLEIKVMKLSAAVEAKDAQIERLKHRAAAARKARAKGRRGKSR